MTSLKKRLKDGELVLGTWITINHPDVVDALSELPFDWLVFDMEHAPLEISDVEVLLMPLRNNGITPLIRIPWSDVLLVKRALDIGAKGILVPWVNNGKEAENAVKYASYPPRGIRGVGPRRCIRYGARDFLDYYQKFEQEERVIIVQVETQKALDNLEEIASTSGIDAVFVGPMDLSTNLGIAGQFDHPKFKEALEKVLVACKKYDIAPGIHSFNAEMAKRAVSQGFKFIALMSDLAIMRMGFRRILREFGRGEERVSIGY